MAVTANVGRDGAHFDLNNRPCRFSLETGNQGTRSLLLH